LRIDILLFLFAMALLAVFGAFGALWLAVFVAAVLMLQWPGRARRFVSVSRDAIRMVKDGRVIEEMRVAEIEFAQWSFFRSRISIGSKGGSVIMTIPGRFLNSHIRNWKVVQRLREVAPELVVSASAFSLRFDRREQPQ
jgi:hypothetical protein